ncbi:MAG: GGDEF domain-containing protein [Treponema sp.]|jgi:diguanylate cyclase (GGDEF)-like protein|nr:GGDEF domain-containing protein [Treponema sp.]
MINNLSLALNSTLGSILIVILILITYLRLYSIDRYRRTLFSSLLVFCLAAITSDLLSLLFRDIPGGVAHSFRYLFSASHYLFQVLSCYYIMVFVDYMTFKRSYRSGQMLKITYIIFGAYALILLLNFILEVFFHIDPANNVIYEKGRFYLRLVVCYSPLLFAAGELFRYRSLFKKSQLAVFFALPALFLAGSTLDLLLSEARLVWPCVTAALLYAYFFIVQSHVSIDPLTETGNRLSFNEFTDKLSRSATGESWAIVMIDLDHFKAINDNYGHHEGDNALGYTAEIIKSCVKKDDFVARYGGDEFVLATKVEKDTAESKITSLMSEIQIVINIFNEREFSPFKIEMSYGFDVYTADGRQSIGEFLNHIDALMYKNKQERRRRAGDRREEAAR